MRLPDFSKIKVPDNMVIQVDKAVVHIFFKDGTAVGGGPIISMNAAEWCWDFGHRDPAFCRSKKKLNLLGKNKTQQAFDIIFAEMERAMAHRL